MNNATHLASLLTMPPADFEHYWAAVRQIAAWRQLPATESGPTVAPSEEAAPAAKPPVRHPLPQRNPMRAPQPGSLRGAIHELLRSRGKPLQRAQIISEVASRRGDELTENYKSKAGDLLANRHDPFIRRVGRGLYAYDPHE